MRVSGLLTTLALAAAALPAEAAVTITIRDVGPDVVATLSGSLDLTGMTYTGAGATGRFVWSERAMAAFAGNIKYYQAVTGPTNWGSTDPLADLFFATSKTGDAFLLGGTAFQSLLPTIGVPDGYVNGAALAASMTFAGETIENMNLDPGRYVYELPNDLVVVRIGSVPEPASWAMMIAGFGLVGAAMRRRAVAVT